MCEFSFGDSRGGVDDPDAVCPVTLHRCLSSAADRCIATAVMRTIAQRGCLGELLAQYPQKSRSRLEGLYLADAT